MSKHKIAVIGSGEQGRPMRFFDLMAERQAGYRQGVKAERERLYKLSANEFLAEKLSGHIEQSNE